MSLHEYKTLAFRQLCKEGNIKRVKEWITSPALKEYMSIYHGINYACEGNSLEVVKYLLAFQEIEGVPHEEQKNNLYGFTSACALNNISIVKYILENYSHLVQGWIPSGFHDALRNEHYDVCKLIAKQDDFLSDNLDILFNQLGEQNIIEVIKTLSAKQQHSLYNQHPLELFQIYLENNIPIPVDNDKTEEIDIFI